MLAMSLFILEFPLNMYVFLSQRINSRLSVTRIFYSENAQRTIMVNVHLKNLLHHLL